MREFCARIDGQLFTMKLYAYSCVLILIAHGAAFVAPIEEPDENVHQIPSLFLAKPEVDEITYLRAENKRLAMEIGKLKHQKNSTAKAVHKDALQLSNNHEEADTKMILHGKHVAEEGGTTLHIYSPDTDVLILALRRYPDLPPDTSMYLGIGMKRCVALKPIYNALGPLKAAALPALHALSGCDTTGSFANKDKPSWWNIFKNASDEILNTLASFGVNVMLSDEIIGNLEKFVCQFYISKAAIKDIGEARLWIFSKKHQYDEHLPPTRDALLLALRRAHFLAIIWHQDIEAVQNVSSPLEYGWSKSGDYFEAVPSAKPSAPECLVEMIKCSCKQRRCTQVFSCHNNGLECTEMCLCNGDLKACDNLKNDDENEDGDW